MRSYVIKFSDVATAVNDKNETMEQHLLDKFAEYGTVMPLDTFLAKHDEEWQNTVNALKSEYNKVKSVACQDESEVALLKAHRAGEEKAIAGANEEKEKYRAALVQAQNNLDNLKTVIKNAVGD